MTYLEKYILQKGKRSIDDYMSSLGYPICTLYGDDDFKVTYSGNPIRQDVTVIFSEKGRAKQVIYEDNEL